MRQRSLDEMITYFNQEIDKMDIDRRYKIALLGMVTAIGCTAKQTIEVRKKGMWVRNKDGVYCSSCYLGWSYITGVPRDLEVRYNYCPLCGSYNGGGDE